MDRIHNPDREVDDRRFTEGDFELDIEATPLDQAWLNAVQEELCAAVTVDGGKLDPADQGQLSKVLATRALQVSVQRGEHNRSVNFGDADRLVGSFTPAISELTDGLTLQLLCLESNRRASVSFTPHADLVAPTAIVSIKGEPINPGDIPVGWADLRYVKKLGAWTLLNRLEIPVSPQTCIVQVFKSSGTYVKQKGAQSIHLRMVGGAPGGGSGEVSPAGTVAKGGDGGGAPASLEMVINAEDLADYCAVVVGRGGRGGARSSGVGNLGVNGTESLFVAREGVSYSAHQGYGVQANPIEGMYAGGPSGKGGVASAGKAATRGFILTGAGGGGSVDKEGVSYRGGDATLSILYGRSSSFAFGGPDSGGNAVPTIHVPSAARLSWPGVPGSGGGGSARGEGGNGSDGSGYGAPGGGGGGAIAPHLSGAGGKGTDGLVVITTYF